MKYLLSALFILSASSLELWLIAKMFISLSANNVGQGIAFGLLAWLFGFLISKLTFLGLALLLKD